MLKFAIKVIIRLVPQKILNKIPDAIFLKIRYYAGVGKKLNLENPQTFNEKLQWLKLYDRKPEYTVMVDKHAVKKYVADQIGDEYVIPTLGVWNSFDEIDFDSLPDQFVLKCTHDSGGLVICRDKKTLDIDSAKKKIEKSLKQNFFYRCREWPYKNVPPRIMAEQYMQDGDSRNLPVYKILNFSGEPRIIQVIQNDKTKNETIDYFDTRWHLLKMKQNFPNSAIPMERPVCLSEMLDLARKLSKDLPVIRVDLYEVNGKVYFSEYTFYSDAGFAAFYPEKWDNILGNWISIPALGFCESFYENDMMYR